MVIQYDDPHCRQIVIMPNRSMNWRGNLKIFGVISLLLLCASAGFTLAGAWMVLPFAGLELLVILIAFYLCYWKQSIREVIQIEGKELIIDRGFGSPQNQWRFPLADVRVGVRSREHPWDPLHIIIYSENSNCHVELGNFLSRDETQQLLKALRHAQLPIGDYSPHSYSSF